MPLHFDKYAQEGNKFLKFLSSELGYHDESENDRSAFILRSVLHTLRDRITVSESLNLLSQLPMFLKAVYVDGWKYKEKPEKIKKLSEFIEKANENNRVYNPDNFYKYVIDEKTIATVISALRTYISEGELEDIISQLPGELKPLISYAIRKG